MVPKVFEPLKFDCIYVAGINQLKVLPFDEVVFFHAINLFWIRAFDETIVSFIITFLVQSNFNGSNTFGTMKIGSRQG